jgi:hypothetical protein
MKDEQKVRHSVGVVSHKLVYDGVRAALSLLASLGAQGKSLAKDHSLDSTLDVNSAARHTEPA